MQNYHRHTCGSNPTVADSIVFNEDYAKRAIELGHKILCSLEHGWQGRYHEVYELAHKYGLKCVIGAEAYWVRNRHEADNSNHHIVILAKNNNGREWLNEILSEANETGYYYRPRVDIELLMQLPPDDVFITTACTSFKKDDDVDDVILMLYEHFGKNFMLEVQYHNTESQIAWNKHLVELSDQYGIELIVGLDSHYIYEKDAELRDYFLTADGKPRYDDEAGWYMDYPSDEVVIKRFIEQGVFTDVDQIKHMMDNSDICLTFGDYDGVPIFTKNKKLPTLYPNESKVQRDKRYSQLITKEFKSYVKDSNIKGEEYKKYLEGIKSEVQVYKDTGMVDYPLLNYEIIKYGVEHGGLITSSGRGSAVGFMTNTLCGFSKVDRFKSDIKLYPERFMSTTRILESNSLPDIDFNVGTVSIFEDAQKAILGENHVAPMVAFGTAKKKKAFKLYAKAHGLDFDLANKVSEQIGKYDDALRYAEDDDARDLIDLHDYVDEEYWDLVEKSKSFWGILTDKKKAPSAYLLYQGNIRREIGLMKCKSDSTKKEYMVCCIDGAVAENYKFLKNDILKVDSVLLIHKVFERIGIPEFNVNTLLEKIKDDEKTWDIYSNGYTIGINQCEQDASRHKVVKYKPRNISELSAFIAAIRPGFKSMYKRFEAREDFKWGIDVLDNLLRTEELPVSFLFFQEQVMAVLNYAGFPLDECYGIIKAIAKKHPEKVRPLKTRFIDGFRKKLIADEHLDIDIAQKYAEDVWIIVNDNCGYGFNSAHAYCMALDSVYQAWQKANYPYEFYEILLQHYSDKGKKDKVAALKAEMKKAFGIREGEYKFRKDNRKFVADPENHCIYPALSSIKGLSNKMAEQLYELKDNNYENFYQLLRDIKNNSIFSSLSEKFEILVRIGYFSEFGDTNLLLIQAKRFFEIGSRSQLGLKDVEKYNIPEYLLIPPYCNKKTAKQYRELDMIAILNKLPIHYKKSNIIDDMNAQLEYFGYIQYTNSKIDDSYYFVQEIENNWMTIYQICSGDSIKIKFRKPYWNRNPVMPGQLINVLDIHPEHKKRPLKDENGVEIKDEKGKLIWTEIEEMEDILGKWSVIVED